MLRITPIESGKKQLVLQLEGRVSGPWVSELSDVCEEAVRKGIALVLNLAEVSFLDSAGVDLLKKYEHRGAELTQCSIFVREQLKDNA